VGRRQNAAGSDNTWLIVLVLAIVGYFLYKGVATAAASGAATSTTTVAGNPQPVPGRGISFVGADSNIDLATLYGEGVQTYSGDPSLTPLNTGGILDAGIFVAGAPPHVPLQHVL
jgi:hypothetical protein